MKLQGAMTAIVTPMKNGIPDIGTLEHLLEAQISAGIDAIVAVGTTGESGTLSVPEHIGVIEASVRCVAGRVPVIAGAGGNCTREAIELSQACARAGADGLLHVTPYYNKPSQEGLFRHFEEIGKSTDLPVVLYNVPGRTCCDLEVETLARLAESEKFVAIKDATGDMRRAGEIIARCGDSIDLLSGDDFTAFSLLGLGGKGTISVVSNIVPDRVAKMCDAAAAGDWEAAKAHHYSYQALAALLFVESNPIPVKAAMEILGLIDGDIRLPLVPASEQTREALRKELTSEGLL